MSDAAGDGVRDAASLARLPPPDAALLARCRSVIRAFANLPEAGSGPAPPVRPVDSGDVLRDDRPRPGLTAEEALAAAPDAADGTFRVPRVRDVR